MKKMLQYFKKNWWLMLSAIVLGIVVPNLNGVLDEGTIYKKIGICVAGTFIAYGVLGILDHYFHKNNKNSRTK
jgi:hypothetical protein